MKVVCPQCRETVLAPDDAAQMHCPRCRQLLSLAETHVTAAGPGGSAFQPAEREEWIPGQSAPRPALLPESYASWEEFRELSPTLQTERIKLATQALPDMRSLGLRTLPATLPPKLDEFGPPLATLILPGEKRMLNLAVGTLVAVIGCLFLLVGGFELTGNHVQPLHRDGVSAYSIMLLIGLVGIGFGLWQGFLRQPMLEITLWIFEAGLFLQRGNEVEACAWEDVKDFRDSANAGRPTYTILTRGDRKLVLSAEQTPEIMPLAEYIRIKIASAQLMPKLRRIFDGDRIRFGVLWLGRAGIAGPITAHWSQIVRVISDEANLFVDCRGVQTWQQVPLRDISFAPLLLALAHIMIEEAKRLPGVDS